jgi:hypothetical protein
MFMKTILATTLLLIFSVAASAKNIETVEVKTVFTCQQNDGDFWYEVGVVADYKGSHKLLLVNHNTDAGTTTLITGQYATVKKSGDSVEFTSIEDWVNFKLAVKGSNLRGSFIYAEHGPAEALMDGRMDCYKDSTISYEIEAGLEPRMSVGN